MPIRSKLSTVLGGAKTNQDVGLRDPEIQIAARNDDNGEDVDFVDDTIKAEVPSEDAQGGVQRMEAVTLAWSKKELLAMLLLYVFPLQFTDTMTDINFCAVSGFCSSLME